MEDNNITLKYIGEEVLSKQASEVDDVNSSDTQSIIDKMFEIMTKEKGIGLAAPQIGISKRILIIKADSEEFTVINPRITKRSDEFILFTEGCLSVPGKELPILRHQKVTVEFLDKHGNKQTVEALGLLSVVFQHEIDHLDGILMTDRYEQQNLLRQQLNLTQEV